MPLGELYRPTEEQFTAKIRRYSPHLPALRGVSTAGKILGLLVLRLRRGLLRRIFRRARTAMAAASFIADAFIELFIAAFTLSLCRRAFWL